MIRIKRFSLTKILNTRGTPGFDKNRNYDQNMSRLGQMQTAQREMHRVGDIGRELRKMNQELNQGRLGKWQDTD